MRKVIMLVSPCMKDRTPGSRSVMQMGRKLFRARGCFPESREISYPELLSFELLNLGNNLLVHRKRSSADRRVPVGHMCPKFWKDPLYSFLLRFASVKESITLLITLLIDDWGRLAISAKLIPRFSSSPTITHPA